MRCLKCGRETEDELVFCDECLNVAKNYPVKPGTAIHLPKRAAQEEPKKKPYRRALQPEEQVAILHKAVRWLLATAALLAIALGIVSAMLLQELLQPDAMTHRELGRNYTTTATTGD